jgi:catechol 2,3-dioxygenase-like lactoylglutathione lyase family enzyme
MSRRDGQLVAFGGGGSGLLLARADSPTEVARIGDQTGGRVFLFLETDDFDRDHARMIAAGVRFVEEPRHEPYGVVAVFEDLCGNRWDLIQQVDARLRNQSLADAAAPRGGLPQRVLMCSGVEWRTRHDSNV